MVLISRCSEINSATLAYWKTESMCIILLNGVELSASTGRRLHRSLDFSFTIERSAIAEGWGEGWIALQDEHNTK